MIMKNLLLLFTSLFIFANGWATSITVTGKVSGTWNVDTVNVAGDIRINADTSLLIMPGTRVIFQGHFVGNPVMPGVLQIEAMAQTGGILISRIHQKKSRLPYFMSIDGCRFRRIIRPGDRMRIEMEIIASKRLVVKMLGKVTVDGQLASEATIMCMVTDEVVGE